MEIQIRKGDIKDAAGIAEIIRETGWFAWLENEEPGETIIRVEKHIRLCSADDSHSLYVAKDETGRTAGYASVHWLPYLFLTGPEAYLSELFVRADFRGKGVGSRLLDVIIAEAEKRECSRIMLVNSRSRESYIRGFYKARGWVERDLVANLVYWL